MPFTALDRASLKKLFCSGGREGTCTFTEMFGHSGKVLVMELAEHIVLAWSVQSQPAVLHEYIHTDDTAQKSER